MVQDTYTDALHDVFFSLQNTQPSAINDIQRSTLNVQRPTFNVDGRPATSRSPIIIKKNKKIVNNK
jgi:hypothetical protein